MNSKQYLDILGRLDRLIDTKATGTPNDLARKFKRSESSVYRRIEDLRAFGFTIAYDAANVLYPF